MKKIFITLIILASFSFLLNTNAATLSNYIVYRIFDIPEEGEKSIQEIKFNVYNDTKRIGYIIKINSSYAGNMNLLGVEKDFVKNKFRKDIESKNEGGIRVVGRPLDKVNTTFGEVDKKTNIGTYKGGIEYQFLVDGPNYVVLCYQDYSLGGIENVVLRCEHPDRIFYYIKEYNKVVSEKEYKDYAKKRQEKFDKQRKNELIKLNEYNKYFDENKIKKSRFGRNTKIKTHQDLQKSILENLIGKTINKNKIDNIVKSAYSNIYHYDDNDKVFSYQNMINYIRYTINEFIYQKENNGIEILNTDKSIEEVVYGKTTQNTQNSNTTSTENTNTPQTTQNTNTNQYSSNNSNFSNIEKFKEQNAKDRAKAIDFSKKLLKVLEKYKSKEQKLEKLQYIKEIINTQYSPEKFKNQNLIGYVKDYLDIVEYAINLQ